MIFQYFCQNFSEKKTNSFLGIILVIDLLFIIAHLTIGVIASLDPNFKWTLYEPIMVTTEKGYPEYFQFVKYTSIILALGLIINKEKAKNYIFWISLFILLFLDDSLEIHEKAGIIIGENITFKPFYGLREQDIGELIYAGAMGLLVVFIMVLSFKNSNKLFKRTSIDISILLVIFLFFGIVIDFAHVLFNSNEYVSFILGWLEDSGEMILLSLIAWYILYLLYFGKDQKNICISFSTKNISLNTKYNFKFLNYFGFTCRLLFIQQR